MMIIFTMAAEIGVWLYFTETSFCLRSTGRVTIPFNVGLSAYYSQSHAVVVTWDLN